MACNTPIAAKSSKPQMSQSRRNNISCMQPKRGGGRLTGGGGSLALKAKYLKLAAITAICMWVFVGCRQRTTQLSAASVGALLWLCRSAAPEKRFSCMRVAFLKACQVVVPVFPNN